MSFRKLSMLNLDLKIMKIHEKKICVISSNFFSNTYNIKLKHLKSYIIIK